MQVFAGSKMQHHRLKQYSSDRSAENKKQKKVWCWPHKDVHIESHKFPTNDKFLPVNDSCLFVRRSLELHFVRWKQFFAQLEEQETTENYFIIRVGALMSSRGRKRVSVQNLRSQVKINCWNKNNKMRDADAMDLFCQRTYRCIRNICLQKFTSWSNRFVFSTLNNTIYRIYTPLVRNHYYLFASHAYFGCGTCAGEGCHTSTYLSNVQLALVVLRFDRMPPEPWLWPQMLVLLVVLRSALPCNDYGWNGICSNQKIRQRWWCNVKGIPKWIGGDSELGNIILKCKSLLLLWWDVGGATDENA